jgi:predicted Zn-dependent protease
MLGKNNAGGAVVNRFSDDLQLFVSGTVAININTYNNLKDGYSEGKSKGNLLLHEFGHLVGLDHVDDKSALMHPSINDLTENGLNSDESDVLHTFPASCKS